MALVLGFRAVVKCLDDSVLKFRRDDAHEHRIHQVDLAAGSIDSVVPEHLVDPFAQDFAPFREGLGIGIFAKDTRHLLQVHEGLDDRAVVHQVHGSRILDVHHLLGRRPVTQIPPSVRRGGPFLQETVDRVGVDIIHEPLHHGIETFHRPHVAVTHPSAPGSLDREGAPVRSAACLVWVRGRVRQAAVRTLGILPGLQPVQVERGHVGHGLQGQGRCVPVATISQTLDAGAVDHVSVEC